MVATLAHALTLFFAGSLAVSLLAALRPTRMLAALYLAWFFALLTTLSLVIFAYASAYANTLDLLLLSDMVIFSRPFILFTLGALYLLPVVTLVLEDVGTEQKDSVSDTLQSDDLPLYWGEIPQESSSNVRANGCFLDPLRS